MSGEGEVSETFSCPGTPTDVEIDFDLRLEGFDADEEYPEHGHDALRVAYRAGFSEATRRMPTPPGAPS